MHYRFDRALYQEERKTGAHGGLSGIAGRYRYLTGRSNRQWHVDVPTKSIFSHDEHLAMRVSLPASCLMVAICWMLACGCQGNVSPENNDTSSTAIVSSTPVSPIATKQPGCNFVLVSFDALQAAHVGALGSSRDVTPAIDELARQSFSFTHAYSVASWTVPASMTWFTGVYPSEHRMTNKFAVYRPPQEKLADLRELSPHLVTLADLLKQNGYATGGFTGNAGVNGGFGYEQGFDVYYYQAGNFGGLDQSIPRALSWLNEVKHQKFFLFLHGYDAHGQFSPASGLDYRFVDPEYDRKFLGSPQEHESLREEGLDRGQLNLREPDVQFWRAIYDEKIQRADEQFRGFLKEFDELGLTENTLFILTSDHGTEYCEHRRLDHGFTLYDEQIHVPLFIKLPGQTTGRTLTQGISSIDIMPTVLDLLDVHVADAVNQQLRGRSLLPAMNGSQTAHDVFSETDYRQYTYKRSIITPGGWKLIYTLEHRSRELYNLSADPGELHDQTASRPELADELQARLFARFASIGHDLTSRVWETGFNPVYNFRSDGSSRTTPASK